MKSRVTLLFILMIAFTMLPILSVVQSARADDMTDKYAAYGSGVWLYSPLNKTYTANPLLLNLSFSKGTGMDCNLTYSVDGHGYNEIPLIVSSKQEQFIITQTEASLWLPKLSDGSHYLTIIVNASCDGYKHSWVHTIYFTINTNAIKSNPTATSTAHPSIDTTNTSPTSTKQAPAVDSQEQSPLMAFAVLGLIIVYIAVIVILIHRKGK
jgi:hypothetical protein